MTKYIPFVEEAFGRNDWFLLITCAFLYGIMFRLPKRFPRAFTYQIALLSVAVAGFLDNSFAADPFDYYDIMDGPVYSIMDAVVYFLYVPLAYFFVYFYDFFHFRGRRTIYYLILSSLISVIFELVCVYFHVFHYKNGYVPYFSFIIYLAAQTLTINFYHFLLNHGLKRKSL